MKFICPLITVSDITRSRNFYENILHQKVKFDFGENITFHGDFAIHLTSHFKTLIDNREIRHGGNNFELYFEDSDIDHMFSILQKAGIRFVHGIQEEPWGQRTIRFYDPDMHIIEIGEPIECFVGNLRKKGLTEVQVSAKTGIPVEVIHNISGHDH